MSPAAPAANGFAPHDHALCVAAALDAAEALCALRGLRLTPVRRRVLELLLAGHKAMGAYDLLQTLAAEGLGAQPPVVYRALHFLQQHGLVHRVAQRNAFVACTRPGRAHAPTLLICRACDRVVETAVAGPGGGLERAADAAGFEIEERVIEATGLCPDCRPAPGAAP